MKLYLLLLSFTVTIHSRETWKGMDGKEHKGTSTCSGVFVSKNTILTADHCIEQAEKTWIKTSEGYSLEAKVIKKSKPVDLALLKVMGFHSYANLVSKEPYITESVYTVNSGNDYEASYAEGVISNFVKDIDTQALQIMDTVPIAQGASGSGLFDKHGKLVGINVSKDSTMSFAVNTEDIAIFLME